MDRKQVSKKDQIILQQLEVIRTMTENNLNRMGADFWGTPPAASGGAPERETPAEGPEKAGATASAGENSAKPPEKEAPPPEKI